ncbi:MAG: sulfite exporter TauE/SafE family protein [Gemmataceae bacterium]
MIDAPLIVLGGLLGSAHCVGMCGGFVLTLSVRGRYPWAELRRQLVYAAGRIFTYICYGATAGYVGLRFTHLLPSAVQAQGWLCIVAGLFLTVQGAVEAGLWPRRAILPGSNCLGPGMFAALWQAARWQGTFIAGVINGLLPCGLVYAFLALAGSSGGVWSGAATMALFGLGTVPALALFGTGGGYLSQPVRRKVVTLAAWCVLVTGLLSVARGASFLKADQASAAATSCPLCEPS